MISKISFILKACIAILLLYSAYYKIWHWDDFEVQLYTSILIADRYIPFLMFFLPSFEILISIIIFYFYKKNIGLFLSFFLLLLYTFYLIVLNKFSFSSICTNGGLFDGLDYSRHLLINLFFLMLNLIAIYLNRNYVSCKNLQSNLF